jgi:dynein light chain 1
VQRREGRARRRHLSLSTNNIEKITNLAGLDSLQVLSLGRNQIKKLENLDPLAETLLELWVSYNLLERLARPLRARCIY